MAPSGTGPFRLDKFVPRASADLVKTPTTGTRSVCPNVDRMILIPIPEALNTAPTRCSRARST